MPPLVRVGFAWERAAGSARDDALLVTVVRRAARTRDFLGWVSRFLASGDVARFRAGIFATTWGRERDGDRERSRWGTPLPTQNVVLSPSARVSHQAAQMSAQCPVHAPRCPGVGRDVARRAEISWQLGAWVGRGARRACQRRLGGCSIRTSPASQVNLAARSARATVVLPQPSTRPISRRLRPAPRMRRARARSRALST